MKQMIAKRFTSFSIISRFVNELTKTVWFKDGGCFSTTCCDEIVVIKSLVIMILEVSVPHAKSNELSVLFFHSTSWVRL